MADERTSMGGSIQPDLLHLRDPAPGAGDNHLDFQAEAAKSLEEPFYRADTGLHYYTRRLDNLWLEQTLRAYYRGAKEPLGEADHVRHSGVFDAGFGLKLAPNTRLWLDTGFRRADDTIRDGSGFPTSNTDANEQPTRLLFEAIPPGFHGFFRASMWEENGWQTGSAASYQRLVSLPIPLQGWFTPLVPNETTDLPGPDGKPR